MATRYGRWPPRWSCRCPRSATISLEGWHDCARSSRLMMTELLKGLQAYAAHLDTVDPVTPHEARDRVDLPPYSSDRIRVVTPASRHRRSLIAAAAVLAACLVAALAWDRT